MVEHKWNQKVLFIDVSSRVWSYLFNYWANVNAMLCSSNRLRWLSPIDQSNATFCYGPHDHE